MIVNERLISILSWFFGILIIFAGLRAFSTSFIGGSLAVLAGILLLPIFQNKIDGVLNKKIMKRWFVFIAFILMVISGNIIGKAEERALKDGTASQELKEREANRSKLENEKNELEAKKAEDQRLKDVQRQERDRQISIEVDSEIALKKFLKDPDSAEIRNRIGNCGEVNSKNSFGGYTGFRRFIANSAVVAVDGENMDSDEFQKAWDQVCK